MTELVVVLMMWATAVAGLPPTSDLPRIAFASRATLAALHTGQATTRSLDIEGVYHTPTRTIVLAADWDADDPVDVSVLVHEIVHHLQESAGERYACPQEREARAYAVQEQWLAIFGLDLQQAFEIDRMTLLLRTKCLPH